MSGWSGWADENGKVGKSKPRGRRILPLLGPAKPAQTGKKNHVVLPSSIRAERKKENTNGRGRRRNVQKGKKILSRSHTFCSSFFFLFPLDSRQRKKKEKKGKKTNFTGPVIKILVPKRSFLNDKSGE